MKDRLTPIMLGTLSIEVDTFIIGTQDKYIATIARVPDWETVADFTLSMQEIYNRHSPGSLILLEKMAFDKKAKSVSLAERNLVLKADYQTRLATEPVINSDMQEALPGSIQEFLWNTIAGSGGLGAKILPGYPEPVELDTRYKHPVDKDRYVSLMRNAIGGVFFDKSSIQKTDEGCSALTVEAFSFDAETQYGAIVMQYSGQGYDDAYYAVARHEYSFDKIGYRQTHLTIFNPKNTVIYSIKNHNTGWIFDNTDPMLPFAFTALRENLPQEIAALLRDDIKKFDAHVQASIAKAVEARNSSR